ncbi:MAG: M20 family metallopeptidase [Planctomycetota bacterium]|nr:M20 family metallopeptidase [Planctomycetota bacterium]
MTTLSAAISDILDATIQLRQHIHAYPEPGFEEVETQARLIKEVRALGLEPVICGKTGLYVDLGDGQGPKIALRADIDCLRMTEGNHHLAYRSKKEGLAHMCGHDGHTASLMGALSVLSKVREKIKGTVRIFFQPAEEGPGGAPLMIEEGVLNDISEVYGMHNWPEAPLGELRTIPGPCMATVTTMSMSIHGKGGHGSQPQESIDPVLTAAHIITALQSIVSRNMHSKDAVVISVTMVHGGEATNVIPDKVDLGGTVRTLSDSLMDDVCERIEKVATATADAFGATVDIELFRKYPVLVNDPGCTETVKRVGREHFGAENVNEIKLPMLGAEDFAYYTQKTPGCFFFLGGGEEGRSNSMCHSTDYDFNDALLDPAIQFWVRLTEDRLKVKLFD